MKNFLAILFLSLSVLFWACADEKLKPKDKINLKSEDIPAQESWNSEMYFTEEGKLKAILYADKIMVFEDKNETLLEGVKIDFYNEFEEKTSSLTSKKGRVDDRTKNMYAVDSVIAVNDSAGVTLKTDELMWENGTQKIQSEKYVKIINPDEVIEGYGFESDQSLTNYKIFNITYVTVPEKNQTTK